MTDLGRFQIALSYDIRCTPPGLAEPFHPATQQEGATLGLEVSFVAVGGVRRDCSLWQHTYESVSLAGFLGHHMDRMLRKGNLNVILIKGFLDLAGNVEFKGPVIILVHPRSNNEINT